jgi:Ribonuclease G/E
MKTDRALQPKIKIGYGWMQSLDDGGKGFGGYINTMCPHCHGRGQYTYTAYVNEAKENGQEYTDQGKKIPDIVMYCKKLSKVFWNGG